MKFVITFVIFFLIVYLSLSLWRDMRLSRKEKMTVLKGFVLASAAASVVVVSFALLFSI